MTPRDSTVLSVQVHEELYTLLLKHLPEVSLENLLKNIN